MVKFSKHHQEGSVSDDPIPEKRENGCRRVSFDTKYLGLGKCIDRRKAVRRKSDRFDPDEYEKLCRERLGPGWL